MRILLCASEVVPFAKTGGMADVCGALPAALAKLGLEVAVVLPCYDAVRQCGEPLEPLCEGVFTASLGENVPVYLLDHPGFFRREGIYGDATGDYPDNLQRFDFFCRRILSLIKDRNWRPDIIHCHDWQTALIPVLLKHVFSQDPFFRDVKTLMTIHNLAYQGVFPKEQFAALTMAPGLFLQAGFEFYGKLNLLKAGIINSDVVSTVSPAYAQEIQTAQNGCGLDGVLRGRSDVLIGILNGLDYDVWDPKTDPFLETRYDVTAMAGKDRNKARLQKQNHFEVRRDLPVVGFVGRLAHQKGIDLLVPALEKMASQEMQVVILGTGEDKYQRMLADLARRFPRKIAVHLVFDEALAHQIYAGSDLFMMPSVFEPCGLSQMISLRYGTIPIVYNTGGLADTVKPYEHGGNGFVFSEYNVGAFVEAMTGGMEIFSDQEKFRLLVKKAMHSDFSWHQSARQYQGLFNQCLLT